VNTIIIIICKIIGYLLNKIGRGSVYPGAVAIKINRNIMNYFKLPTITICVTGTTGKTSISGTLSEIYRHAGYKVAHNSKGSNLKLGVLTCLLDSSNIFGKIEADVLILEVDERYIKQVFNSIKPNFFIINNLSRDQLARNGHHDIVWKDIADNITKDMHLILNIDDPLINKFSLNHSGKTTFYGLSKTINSKKQTPLNSLDLVYCPICNKKLIFEYFHYGNLGKYKCPNKDFERTKPAFEAKLMSDNSFAVDDVIIKMNNTALYTVYNLLACYTTAITSGVEKEKIVEALGNLSSKIKRLDTVIFNNKECVLLLSKNETPISYNQSLEYIERQKGTKTVVIGFDRVSGRYDLKDLSWLWDINFELLNDKSIKKVICVGTFANDIAVRLKYANVEKNKIIICVDSSDILTNIKKYGSEKTYCVLYFDIEKKFKKLLKQEG
jgi:UDP-N-acetylmuramyl tripeptide synthase